MTSEIFVEPIGKWLTMFRPGVVPSSSGRSNRIFFCLTLKIKVLRSFETSVTTSQIVFLPLLPLFFSFLPFFFDYCIFYSSLSLSLLRLLSLLFITSPLQAWSGPEGSRKLRFPDYTTTAQDGGKDVSPTHRPPLPPGNAPGTHFC